MGSLYKIFTMITVAFIFACFTVCFQTAAVEIIEFSNEFSWPKLKQLPGALTENFGLLSPISIWPLIATLLIGMFAGIASNQIPGRVVRVDSGERMDNNQDTIDLTTKFFYFGQQEYDELE